MFPLFLFATRSPSQLLQSFYSRPLLSRLFDLCSKGSGSSVLFNKVVHKLDTSPTIFRLSSHDITSSPYLYCHLELQLPSDKYGVQIFIQVKPLLWPWCSYLPSISNSQEMNFSGSHQNCTEDFLQFGRDVLFITTHLRLVGAKYYLEHKIFLCPVPKFVGQSRNSTWQTEEC